MNPKLMHAQLARTKLRSFIDAGAFLDGRMERTMEQLQIAVREARAAAVAMGAVYAPDLDGLTYPISTQAGSYRSVAYPTLEDFDKDLQELLVQYGLNRVVDYDGREFRVAVVPVFNMVTLNEPQHTGA